MEPFCSQIAQSQRLNVLAVNPKEDSAINWQSHLQSLSIGMPSYGAEKYFQTKGKALLESDVIVLVRQEGSEQIVALLAASNSRGDSPSFLYVRTLLIAEKWHRSRAIHLAWRGLFEHLIRKGERFPPIIVFKTVNPKSFAALSAFRGVPGAIVYPFLNWEPVEAVLPTVRAIAAELAPGATFNERSGVLEGASDGVTDFYQDMPLSGTEWIDRHFQEYLTLKDRMLACLFTGGPTGASRILRAFGVRELTIARPAPA